MTTLAGFPASSTRVGCITINAYDILPNLRGLEPFETVEGDLVLKGLQALTVPCAPPPHLPSRKAHRAPAGA